MKGFLLLFTVLIILFSITLVSAQENSLTQQDNNYSIGINHFPMGFPNIVELRHWKSEVKGTRLTIYSSLNLQSDSNNEVIIRIPNVEFVWMNRHKIRGTNMAHYYKGIGFGVEGVYYRTPGEATTIHVYLNIPLGVEFSFIKSMPYITYSIEASFSAGISYGYQKPNDTTPSVSKLALGFDATPRLLLNCYFK